MDYSLPGSSIQGIFQARTLEWGAISFHLCCCSVTKLCPIFCYPMDWSTPGLPVPYHLLKFAQIHVHCINGDIRPSHSDALFSFCPQSFPAPGSFPISGLFVSGSQNPGASASASVLPMSIQGWLPIRLTGLVSLLSKGLSEVFSSTTVWRHQFFGPLPSLQSNSHNCTWPLEDHSLDYMDLCQQSNVSDFQHAV